jgi:hypothetical protein
MTEIYAIEGGFKNYTAQADRTQPQAPIAPRAVQNSHPFLISTAKFPHSLHALPRSGW